jgi:hypothetical protein
MRTRLRDNAPAVLLSAAAISLVGWLALYGWAWTDYDDEVRPAFDALVGGHVLGFLQMAPAYGGSLILRAPFVLATQLWGGGDLSIYRAAAAPCLAAAAILGVWLVARMRTLGRSKLARGLALFLCVANPITLPALEIGHPEELLGAVLCVAAVLVALRGRGVLAGVLLGLAVANKEWAILATGPVLLALPAQRWRALLAAGVTCSVILAPVFLAGSALSQLKGSASSSNPIFQPWQAWWFLGSHGHIVRGLWGNIKIGYRTPPGWINQVAHPLIVVLTVPLTLFCVRVRRRGGRRATNDALLLLALVMLVRCALDPWDISYYSLPFLIAFLVWESLSRNRPPVLALAASLISWFVFQGAAARGLSADAQAAIFLAVAVSAIAAIATALYAPGLTERLAVRVRRRTVVPSPA